MGSKDAVKPALEALGTVHFGKVKMKPGKPLTFATLPKSDGTRFFFGLPGNLFFSFSMTEPRFRQSCELLCLFSFVCIASASRFARMETSLAATHRHRFGPRSPFGSCSS